MSLKCYSSRSYGLSITSLSPLVKEAHVRNTSMGYSGYESTSSRLFKCDFRYNRDCNIHEPRQVTKREYKRKREKEKKKEEGGQEKEKKMKARLGSWGGEVEKEIEEDLAALLEAMKQLPSQGDGGKGQRGGQSDRVGSTMSGARSRTRS